MINDLPLSHQLNTPLMQCISFAREIGLSVELASGASGFTTGVDIRDGVLLADVDVATPSNFLHEAGHLAIIPAQFRSWMQSDVKYGMQRMYDAIRDMPVEADSPLDRAVLQCSDVEATAWAWAAGRHLNIPDAIIIADEDYDGAGADIRLMLSMNRYYGINGLSRAGFCSKTAFVAKVTGEPLFPKMNKWVQPADLALA